MPDVTLALTGLESTATPGAAVVSSARALTGSGAVAGRGTIKFNTVGLLTGRGFKSFPMITGVPVTSALTGSPFATSPKLYQAAVGNGSGFATTPTLTATARNESFLTGQGFNTVLEAVWVASSNGSATGRGFGTNANLFGAGVATGRGFGTHPVLSGTAPIFGQLSGRGFATGFLASGEGFITAKLIGRGFNSALGFSGRLTGRGFETRLKAALQDGEVFSSAFVMNADTGQVTRYTNFPFNNIIVVNEKYYGVTDSGFYLWEGSTDAGTEVVGSITTKDDDFGDMFSKNVPFVYLGCDDTDIAVTPIVDDYTYPTYIEDFDGRKVKMARGIKGRYWRLRIDKIKKLQSIETLQETLGRRVK